MKQFTLVAAIMVAGLGAGCGKDEAKSGGGGGGGGAAAPKVEGGPSCADAAAAYVKNNMDSGGNPLYAMKPTPEQLAAVTAKLVENCTASNWSQTSKDCIVKAAPMGLGKCWKDAMAGARVSQVVFDYVQATQPATP